MYDGTFVNTTDGCSQYESGCGLMQLYDVGMSSMFVPSSPNTSWIYPEPAYPERVHRYHVL